MVKKRSLASANSTLNNKKIGPAEPKKIGAGTGTAHRMRISLVQKQNIFLFLFALALYANTLGHDFALDDALFITQNKFTLQGTDGIPEIMTNDAFVGLFGNANLLPGGRYRPLTQVMFAIEYEWFGLNPFVGHFINFILYAFLGLLVFKVLRMLVNGRSPQAVFSLPFIATLLFIAHPLHTEVVANIKGRDEIMSILGTLGCLYFTLRYLENKRRVYLPLLFLLFFLSILSKENALAWVVVIPLSVWFFTKSTFREQFTVSAPLLLAITGYFVLRAATVGFVMQDVNDTELLNNPFLGTTFFEKYATIFYTWLKYFILLIFPHPLTHDYYPKQIPIIGFNDMRALAGLALSAATLIIALVLLKRKHIVSYAIFFFWLTFGMSSNFILNIGAFMNERFLFAPLLGFAITVGWFITEPVKSWLPDPRRWKAVLILLIALVAGFSLKTFTRNLVWENDFVLFTTDVEVSTNSAKCNTSAGGKLMEWSDSTTNPQIRQDYLIRSQKYLSKAIEVYPGNIHPWLLLGNLYIKTQQYPEAVDCFKTCLKLRPAYPDALNNMLHVAQVTYRDGIYPQSVATYRALMGVRPANPAYTYGLGLNFEKTQQIDSALYWYRQTLERDSLHAASWARLGEIHGKILNDLTTSEICLRKAVEINPSDASSLENLGIIHALRLDYSAAIGYFQQAYKLNPENISLCMNMAKTYERMGDQQNAERYYEMARRAGRP